MNRLLRCREDAVDHRLEKFQRGAVIGLVERGLIVDFTEACRVLEMRVAAELLAQVAVEAEVVEEIIALEDAMVGDHPVQFLVDERLQDGRGDVGVVVAAQRVADVMKQGPDDILFALAGAVGAGGGLQAVLQPVDREAAIIAV